MDATDRTEVYTLPGLINVGEKNCLWRQATAFAPCFYCEATAFASCFHCLRDKESAFPCSPLNPGVSALGNENQRQHNASQRQPTPTCGPQAPAARWTSVPTGSSPSPRTWRSSCTNPLPLPCVCTAFAITQDAAFALGFHCVRGNDSPCSLAPCSLARPQVYLRLNRPPEGRQAAPLEFRRGHRVGVCRNAPAVSEPRNTCRLQETPTFSSRCCCRLSTLCPSAGPRAEHNLADSRGAAAPAPPPHTHTQHGSMDDSPTRWPESPRIVMRCALRASNGPNHLGL